MVRLFIDDGSNIRLFMEIRIPAVTQTGVSPAFGITIPVGISLEASFLLKASTQNAETFNITAYGQSWTNCTCPS
ncbi:MAG: hypothetical protein H6551_03050 [Chitinophagales bacterium]|nr:hypothetical protein [Chitinophagales bacterium]